METVALIGAIYLLFGVPTAIGGLLVWLFGRKRMQLHLADWLLLIVPWAVWLGATAVHDGSKTLSNIVEAVLLGCITVFLFAARAILGQARPQQQASLAMAALAGSCVAALALWALVPGLPE